MQIVNVVTPEHLALVRALFEEYWTSFGFTPCFQNFSGELAALPGDYVPPAGRLALAMVDGQPAGCAALRRFDSDRCEFKRLFVRPQFRGLGLGRQLLAWVIAEAKAAGYRQLVCDTMPVMADALAMYERAGFERTAPYSGHPTPGAIFLRLVLAS
jgi:GNAT superfamily N-acetyltransferase